MKKKKEKENDQVRQLWKAYPAVPVISCLISGLFQLTRQDRNCVRTTRVQVSRTPFTLLVFQVQR